MIWRYYGEVFVLIAAAFLVGSLVAAVAVRLLVREQAPPREAKPPKAKASAEPEAADAGVAAGGDH